MCKLGEQTYTWCRISIRFAFSVLFIPVRPVKFSHTRINQLICRSWRCFHEVDDKGPIKWGGGRDYCNLHVVSWDTKQIYTVGYTIGIYALTT